MTRVVVNDAIRHENLVNILDARTGKCSVKSGMPTTRHGAGKCDVSQERIAPRIEYGCADNTERASIGKSPHNSASRDQARNGSRSSNGQSGQCWIRNQAHHHGSRRGANCYISRSASVDGSHRTASTARAGATDSDVVERSIAGAINYRGPRDAESWVRGRIESRGVGNSNARE